MPSTVSKHISISPLDFPSWSCSYSWAHSKVVCFKRLTWVHGSLMDWETCTWWWYLIYFLDWLGRQLEKLINLLTYSFMSSPRTERIQQSQMTHGLELSWWDLHQEIWVLRQAVVAVSSTWWTCKDCRWRQKGMSKALLKNFSKSKNKNAHEVKNQNMGWVPAGLCVSKTKWHLYVCLMERHNSLLAPAKTELL